MNGIERQLSLFYYTYQNNQSNSINLRWIIKIGKSSKFALDSQILTQIYLKKETLIFREFRINKCNELNE